MPRTQSVWILVVIIGVVLGCSRAGNQLADRHADSDQTSSHDRVRTGSSDTPRSPDATAAKATSPRDRTSSAPRTADRTTTRRPSLRDRGESPGDNPANARGAPQPSENSRNKRPTGPPPLPPFPGKSGKTGTDVGDMIPQIVGKDVEGVKFKLTDYEGKVVMLDFWGDW